MTDVGAPSSGNFIILEHREVAVRGRGERYVWIEDADWVDPRLERTTSAAGTHLVKVPEEALERYFRRTVSAIWRGHRVTVHRVVPPGRAVIFYDGDPVWAARVGMDGSQYEGRTGWAALDELSEVTAAERDYPLGST